MASTVPSDRPLQASLQQLGLYSEDPERLADFYAKALGYSFASAGSARVGNGRDRRLTIVGGPSKRLHHAGYAVADVEELMRLDARLRAAGIDVAAAAVTGFEPGALEFADPDGNHFVFGVASPLALQDESPVANRAARIQHVVIATTDLPRLVEFFTRIVGFQLSDRVLDNEGGLRTVFLRCSHEHHSLALFAADENRLDHHCYEAGEWNLIRDWGDHFAKLRVPLKWGPGRHGPGNNLFLFVHDPDGNWVEISAELEHVEPDRPVGEWPHEEYTLNTWGIGLLRS